MELFEKNVIPKKALSLMFSWVLNVPLALLMNVLKLMIEYNARMYVKDAVFCRIETAASIYFFFQKERLSFQGGVCSMAASIYRTLCKNSALSNSFFK